MKQILLVIGFLSSLNFLLGDEALDDLASSLPLINQKFQEIYLGLEETLNAAYSRQSQQNRILNAQLISRLAFVISDIHTVRYDVMEAIEQRHEVIGTNQAACLLTAVEDIENEESQVHETIQTVTNEMFQNVSALHGDFLFPSLRELQANSNSLQLTVPNTIHQENVVTNANLLLDKLNLEFENAHNIERQSIVQIEEEFTRIRNRMNEMKAELFFTMQESIQQFQIKGESIKKSLENCYPDEIE